MVLTKYCKEEIKELINKLEKFGSSEFSHEDKNEKDREKEKDQNDEKREKEKNKEIWSKDKSKLRNEFEKKIEGK